MNAKRSNYEQCVVISAGKLINSVFS